MQFVNSIAHQHSLLYGRQHQRYNVWRSSGKIIRTVLCVVLCMTVVQCTVIQRCKQFGLVLRFFVSLPRFVFCVSMSILCCCVSIS